MFMRFTDRGKPNVLPEIVAAFVTGNSEKLVEKVPDTVLTPEQKLLNDPPLGIQVAHP